MITYRETHTYKYILEKNYKVDIGQEFDLNGAINTKFIKLENGILFIKKSYRWDGPSGPTIDTKTFMRGSIVHDALYQLMREGELPYEFRKDVDKLLVEHCKEDGMNFFRRHLVYFGIRMAGGAAARRKKDSPIETAP